MTILCPHCLGALKNGFSGDCPHCGKSLENANPEGALPLGTQLGGRYTIGNYLRADGDGLSYRAVENETAQFVLIKEYFPVTLCNGRSREGALMPKEGREVLFKTSRMDFEDLYAELHRLTPAVGLAQILDVLEENNTIYAVEENEKGMTLTHYLSLRSRNMTPAEARTMLQPVMEGVALLHKAGLIHRGICPENILLPIDGTARLTGYGTLALRTGGSELKSQLYEGYAAPEQYSAAEFSGRYTDVYALAAVTYRLVTGQTPVSAPQRKVKDSLESAHSLDVTVPTYFSQVVDCAMRLDPAKRMQTVPELMSALANPSVANAMFERGENQISTKKILGAALVIIFVLTALLLWSLLRALPGDNAAQGGGAASATATPAPTAMALPAGSGAGSSQAQPGGNDDITLIPDLVGKKYTTEIKYAELYADYRIVMTEEYSADVEKGVVISQTPTAGTLQTDERQILQIVVSKGPNLVEMPAIIGFTQENAIKQLDERGIRYSMLIMQNDGQYAAGCVAKCDVAPGTQINTAEVVVNVFIAGERDDHLVASSTTSSNPDAPADDAAVG
ncbi:MAG: PASTA domain-containing protein [Gemmiger sp.]|nr:PASTA domain-containing protein [Gemmiger sp.]